MAKILGKGVFVLKDWLNSCEKVGGRLVVRTGYSGNWYTDRVIVACYTPAKPFKGGMITNISTKLIDEIRREQKGKKTLTFAKMRELTNKYV